MYLLPDLIKNSAYRFPDNVAFRHENYSVSFEELVKRSNQLATVLTELGVKRGDRVGIFMESSLESAISVYGLMSVGAVFVPLDPNAPPTRIAHVINDCGIKHIVSGAKQNRSLNKLLEDNILLQAIIGINEQLPVKTVSWDDVWRLSQHKDLSVRMLEDDLAYIMYTSGTTGMPKGIMHSHRSG